MITAVIFHKSLLQTGRDWLVVLLTLAFAPFFVVVYDLAFSESASLYRVAVVNHDVPVRTADGRTADIGTGILAALRERPASVGGGDPAPSPLRVVQVTSEAQGQERLRDRESAVLVVLPAGLSADVTAGRPGRVYVHGDLTNTTYLVSAVLAGAKADAYLQDLTGRAGPLQTVEVPLAGSATRTQFDESVSGLLIFAVILMVYMTAMAVARETEQGGMRRLRLSPMTARAYVVGTSAVLVLVALIGVLLTFATAYAFGFRSQGPLWVAVVVTAVTALSIIGVGMAMGAACRTTAQAFVVANFPLGLLMFLSGVMFPLPQPAWFTVAGHGLGPFDLLPPKHAVVALNKVMTLGQGITEVAFELAAVLLLSVAYFGVGAAVLHRFRLRRA